MFREDTQWCFDAAFICLSRTDVPRLCDEVDRLRADYGSIAGILGWLGEPPPVSSIERQLCSDRDRFKELQSSLDRLRAENAELKRGKSYRIDELEADLDAATKRIAELEDHIGNMGIPLTVLVMDEDENGQHREISQDLRQGIRLGYESFKKAAALIAAKEGT